jgi:hypothetical protein
LCPRRLARDRLWCDHDHPRWACTTIRKTLLQLRARGPTGFSYDGVGVPHYGAPALRFGTALTSNDLGHVTPRSVNRSIQAKLNRSGPSPRCGPSRVFSLAALLLSSHRARPSLCPSPTLQGVSYVEHPRELASLYIRTIIPARGDPSPAVLALSGWGYGLFPLLASGGAG